MSEPMTLEKMYNDSQQAAQYELTILVGMRENCKTPAALCKAMTGRWVNLWHRKHGGAFFDGWYFAFSVEDVLPYRRHKGTKTYLRHGLVFNHTRTVEQMVDFLSLIWPHGVTATRELCSKGQWTFMLAEPPDGSFVPQDAEEEKLQAKVAEAEWQHVRALRELKHHQLKRRTELKEAQPEAEPRKKQRSKGK